MTTADISMNDLLTGSNKKKKKNLKEFKMRIKDIFTFKMLKIVKTFGSVYIKMYKSNMVVLRFLFARSLVLASKMTYEFFSHPLFESVTVSRH